MQDGAYLCQNPDQNPDQHSGRADLWDHDVLTVDEAVPDACSLVPPSSPHQNTSSILQSEQLLADAWKEDVPGFFIPVQLKSLVIDSEALGVRAGLGNKRGSRATQFRATPGMTPAFSGT